MKTTKDKSKHSLIEKNNNSVLTSLSFKELFDLSEIQSIQDAFAKATGVASIITETDGKPITSPSNFCRLCSDIIRKTAKGFSNCIYSDAIIGRYNPDGPIVQPCLSGGLWDAGASISVGGKHIANWLIGQVRNEKIDEKLMIEYAKEIGANEKEFRAALDEVTVMSSKQFEQVSQALFLIANQLSQLAYHKIQQDRVISKQQKTEKALLKSEIKYRQIYDNILDVYYEVNLDGIILEISPSIEKHSQYKREDLIGKSLYDIYTDPSDREKLIEIIIKKGIVRDYEINLTDKDGTQHICSMNIELIKDNKNNPTKLVGIFRDITERKQADEALKEKTKFLDQIIETSALSMWISDEKGTAIRTNPACLEFFGATEEEVVGKYNLFQDSVIEKKGFMPVVKDVFKKCKPASFVLDYDFGAVDHVDVRNATRKTIKTVLTPVMGSNKRVSNVIVQAIDLTEIKKSEEEQTRVNKILAEHEKLSLVGQVAGKMAHDFNNVLGIIMGNTELSLLDCKDAETKKTLELIYEQTIRGKNLTKNLVAFAKDQEPKQEFFRIHEKIEIVINLLKKDLEGIELIKGYKPGVPDLLADPGMIEHALINLIQNSIHATSRVEHPMIIMRTYCLEGDICFEIEDNGCGIPKEYLESIYEPSFTLKGNKDVSGSYESTIRGTGYGMSNVKKYIELHKGTILFKSKVGSGTKFTIFLPVIKKELTSEEKVELREEITNFKKYILLVEDETAISDIQYNVLTQEPSNHKVDIANNGKVAMDLFDRNEYDFISLDFVLPGKINGMDVYNHIRKTNKTIPILFISGNIEFLESIKDLKQKDKNIDHQSKPCQNKDYLKSINELLERSIAAK